MARAAVLGRLNWRTAEVVEVRDESATARTLVLEVPSWPGHLAGQHVDVRLTAEDGYSTQRSYSIASAPAGARLELTVQRLEDGEVSPYLTEVLRPGDPLELRGLVGGWFVWHPGAWTRCCCWGVAAGCVAAGDGPPCWSTRGTRQHRSRPNGLDQAAPERGQR
jgi:ferredoxin-NADP reductase